VYDETKGRMMNDEGGLFVVGIGVGILIAFLVYFGPIQGHWQAQCIKAGAAEWRIDQHGAGSFVWFHEDEDGKTVSNENE
jgi:hypothetical protein